MEEMPEFAEVAGGHGVTRPYELPDTWEWGVLEDFKAPEKYSMTDGPYGSNLKSEDYVPSGTRVIRLGNIGVGEFVDRDQSFVSDEKYQSLLKHEAFAGDLVIAALAEPVGRACRVPEHVGQAIVKADCVRLKVAPIFSADFVMNWLNSPIGRKQAEKRSRGIGRKRINLNSLKAVPTPLPPLNEQRRIVAKIEDLSARSRAAKEALDAIPPLLERFRQSVLAAAFRGDLTKQWRQQNPNVEPASELLKRIRQERRHRWEQDYLAQQKAKGKTPKDDKWKDKYEEPEPVDTTDLPELPTGWCWASFSTLFDIEGGGQPPKSTFVSEPREGYIRLLQIRDFKNDDMAVYIPQKTRWRTCAEDDLLIGRYGASVGKICTGKAGAYNVALVKLAYDKTNLQREWVKGYLESENFQSPLALLSRSAQDGFNKSDLARLFVPVAPSLEQYQISAKIDSYSLMISGCAQCLTASTSRLGSLNQSILAKAFRGELVPQDPNDEPASALLERIRAERESTTSAGNGKKRKARA